MDNDVPGTDYCIGFSTCVTRTISIINSLRISAGSHERFLVLEVFGRYAGFTAMLPTMAGVANRCVIPEHKFDIEQLTELLGDRLKIPANMPWCWSQKAPCSAEENGFHGPSQGCLLVMQSWAVSEIWFPIGIG